jgi:hypothetical protein
MNRLWIKMTKTPGSRAIFGKMVLIPDCHYGSGNRGSLESLHEIGKKRSSVPEKLDTEGQLSV